MVAKRLFDGDTLNNHLQEMVSLLGPFPQEFINQVSTRTREQFFTSDGTFLTSLIPHSKPNITTC